MTRSQKKKSKSSSGPAKNKSSIGLVVDVIFLTMNVLLIGCLFLANAACSISPVKVLFPAYLGLAFPIILVLNVIFMIFWMIRRKWFFLISLISLLFCYRSVWDTFPMNWPKKTPENAIKILSYNVHLFDFYSPVGENKILNYLVESNADIICMQEFGFSSDPKKKHLKKDEIIDKLKKKYPYYHIHLTELKRNSSYGVATFSKFPIIKEDLVPYKSKFNSTIFSDMDINGQIVRVFNCHLESDHLTENDKALVVNLGEDFKNEKMNEVANNLSQKLGQSFKFRARQAEIISGKIDSTNLPIILCGDFNDVPVSYAYTKIRGDKLKDAFSESGFGYEHTFNEKIFLFKIDQIMHSKEFQATGFNVDKVNYSDHYPVACYLSIR